MPPQFLNPRFPKLWHGGDFSPEQWPSETLEMDLDLMDEAHCNVFSVGIFSWAALEPSEGQFEFGWLDRVLERFAERGKYAALATPSAAMPAWMAKKYPDILRAGPDGVRRRFADRVNYCPSSPTYRDRCRDMSESLARRYGKHPAVLLWHVSNEYNGACHCDRCQRDFQQWLRHKFEGDIAKLNHAYWTAFWSHTYSDFDEIAAPGNPHGDTSMIGLNLDWRRFVSDQIIDFYRMEAEPLRAHSNIPVTTNLMGTYPGIDYWRLAPHMDVITWDSYPGFGPKRMNLESRIYCSFRHDLNRSFKRKPFLMIESTPGSSNWYTTMTLKRPGGHRMEGIQALAHGSDGVMYFQWRQSRGSQEKFHSAVVSHDGTNKARIFQEVAALGKELETLADIAGSDTPTQAAVIFDWDNAWAIELAGGPKRLDMGYERTVVSHYRAFWEKSIPVDVIESTQDLAPYRLLVAPMLYMIKPGVAKALERFVSVGGTLVLTYWSGLVDDNDLVFQGGFPGPLRELAGIWVKETDGLFDDETNSVSGFGGTFKVRDFCDIVHPEGADVLAAYDREFYAGSPALTCHRYGAGKTYYVAARAEQAFINSLIDKIAKDCGLERDFDGDLPEGVFARRRFSDAGDFLFLINFEDHPATVQGIESGYVEAVSKREAGPSVNLEERGASVLFRPRL